MILGKRKRTNEMRRQDGELKLRGFFFGYKFLGEGARTNLDLPTEGLSQNNPKIIGVAVNVVELIQRPQTRWGFFCGRSIMKFGKGSMAVRLI